MAVSRKFGLLGVPSSAGARTPGQEKGPAALRSAGLVELLDEKGLEVRDHGDLPAFRWRPDPTTRSPQNLPAVVSVATAVAESIEEAVRGGELPLVIGGDCTITVGVVAGMLRAGLDPSLLYFDGGVDLYVPATQPAGHMDSMGVAHLLNEPGSARELADLGTTTPMLEACKVMFFGQSAVSVRPSEDPRDVEGVVFSKHGFHSYPLEVVTGRASEAATAALAEIELDEGPFVVHFDVDVLDFLDCPFADQPEDRGLLLTEAMDCLAVFAGSSRFGGLVVTEINPDHADPEGATLRRFVEGLAGALAGTTVGKRYGTPR
jgi:arginase